MFRRLTVLAVGLAVAGGALTACVGSSPAPTPTPTAVFASEEEAFAAAEETYRAYVDAVNGQWADPQASPDPEEFLVGAALEAELAVDRQFAEAGIRVTGENRVERIDPVSASTVAGDVVLDVCINAEGSAVVNAAGDDITPTDRAPRVLVRVDFVRINDQTLISNSVTANEDGC